MNPNKAKKYLLIPFIILFIFINFSCNKKAQTQSTSWKEYYVEQYDAKVYIRNAKNVLYTVTCADVQGIECSVQLNHECTQEQFDSLQQKLISLGAEFKGDVIKPNTEGYPDLSVYLPLVMSNDELHQIWFELGLEDSPY